MRIVSPVDAMFLLTESGARPMHVGSVLLFEPPPESGPDFAQAAYAILTAGSVVHPRFRTRPTRTFGSPQLMWTTDRDVDLDYHVRRWALPAPGGLDELFELTSQLHGALLDRDRPLWEMHLIEGLRDGRIALYSKMHHALIDGVSALRLVQSTLTSDPTSTRTRPPWQLPPPRHHRTQSRSLVGTAANSLLSAVTAGPAALRIVRAAFDQQLISPFDVPRTLFNVPVSAPRRCAGRSWPLERIKLVKKATGCTINDIVLAMSAGALRDYLSERNALPTKPLVAMVPVSLRPIDDEDDTTDNQVAALLCNLATDERDPVKRLETITQSMRCGKELYRSLSRIEATALSALLLSPLTLTQLPGLAARTNPPFNIVISTVPGPQEALYWNGARHDATYPMSIPVHGLAAGITVTSNASTLDFGLTSCRRALPDLHPIFDHLDRTLTVLEQVC
ncbi:wax ester/triacylglycerol synthase family O-acyltransferase [Nocardia sp. NPDC051463]|uniref:WS/DGAT/MGAT family O-acyltransferase n=1 Tax=Nocardia sp. NPDC051463 TaxID=3154845 RepID=UPI00343F2407